MKAKQYSLIFFVLKCGQIVRLFKNNLMRLFKLFFKNVPIPASFCSFHFPTLMTNLQFDNTNWKKHRLCAWDLNPGWQDGRRRWIHWAMAAPPPCKLFRGGKWLRPQWRLLIKSYKVKPWFWHLFIKTYICNISRFWELVKIFNTSCLFTLTYHLILWLVKSR